MIEKRKNRWNGGLSISGNEKRSTFYTTIVNKIANKNVHLRGKFPESGSCHVSQPDHVSNYVQVVSTFDMGEEEGAGYGVTDHQAHYANIAEEESDHSPGPVHDPLAPRFPPPFSSLPAADPITSTLPVSIGSRIPSYVESSIPFHHSSATRLLKISFTLFLFLISFPHALYTILSVSDFIELFESDPLGYSSWSRMWYGLIADTRERFLASKIQFRSFFFSYTFPFSFLFRFSLDLVDVTYGKILMHYLFFSF